MDAENEKVINFVEAFFMIALSLIADVIDIILKFVLLSDFSLIDIPVTIFFQIWFFLKGARWAYVLGGNLLEFIPYVDALPLRTAGVITAIYITNHPKVAEVIPTPKGKGVSKSV